MAEPAKQRTQVNSRKKPVTRQRPWHVTFLKALEKSANIRMAAAVCGVGRTTVYKRRDEDPEFRAAWDAALEKAIGLYEAEVDRRAFEGLLEPVYYQGEVVGHVKKFSDVLAIFRLKRLDPTYRERLELSGDPGRPVHVRSPMPPYAPKPDDSRSPRSPGV